MAASAMQVHAQKCSSRNWHCKIRKRTSCGPHTWRTGRNCSHRFCAPWWNQVKSACITWNNRADARNMRLASHCAAWSCGNALGVRGANLDQNHPPSVFSSLSTSNSLHTALLERRESLLGLFTPSPIPRALSSSQTKQADSPIIGTDAFRLCIPYNRFLLCPPS